MMQTPGTFGLLHIAFRGCGLGAVACVALAAACSGTRGDALRIVGDSAGVQIAWSNPAALDDACTLSTEPTLTIGVSEGAAEYMLHRVFGAVQLSDGRIALAHDGAGELRYYDANGRHLLSVGRLGDGPGEFRSPFYLWARPGDTIWVGDYRPWRYLVFAPDGKWVRTVQPEPTYLNPPDDFGMLADGRLVLGKVVGFRAESGYFPDTVDVNVHNADGALAGLLVRIPSGRYARVENHPNNLYIYPLFEAFAQYAVGSDRIAVAHSGQAEIRVISAENQLLQIIRFDTQNLRVMPNEVELYRQRQLESAAGRDESFVELYVRPQIDEKRLVTDHFPAVNGLKYDSEGVLWVRTYRRPSDSGPREWHAYARDGTFLCRAYMPLSMEVYEIGRDYVLGLERDSLDVERVVKYRLSRR